MTAKGGGFLDQSRFSTLDVRHPVHLRHQTEKILNGMIGMSRREEAENYIWINTREIENKENKEDDGKK